MKNYFTRLSLRNRFLSAILLIVSVLSIMFYSVSQRSIELIETEIIQSLLMEMLHDFSQTYENLPNTLPPQHGVLTGYVVKDPHDSILPGNILNLGPGFHDDIMVGDSDFMVARQDVNGARIYFLLDIRLVEQLEAELVAFTSISLIITISLSAVLAIWLSRFITRPITQLAESVSQMDPRRRGNSLANRFREQEVSSIANAFDRYTKRLDEFVQREQSFTEDISHELRTPLAVMVSGTRLLQDDTTLPAQTQLRIARLARAAHRMQEMLEALLFLARESGSMAIMDCHIDQIIGDMVGALREPPETASLKIQVETESTVISAPAALAVSVIQNILENAIHHSGNGPISITLKNRELVIADQGKGIATELLSQIFERGFRSASSQGMGLGLSIVKRICERLNWDIQAQSTPEKGARFRIRFPQESASG